MTGGQFLLSMHYELEGIAVASVTENKLTKRSKILDAANRLFLDGSFADTAIDDVVKLAGVAKGTFYLYFRDKYDLLDQIVAHRAAEIFSGECRRLRERAQSQPMDAAQQLISLSDALTAYLQSHKKEAALLDKRFSICYASAEGEPNGAFAEAVDYLTSLLTAGGYTADEAHRRLYLLGNMILYSACDAVLGETPYPVEALQPTLHAMIARMVNGGDQT